MPDKYDARTESLVVEKLTEWPADLGHVPLADRPRIERELHARADRVGLLEYVRTHTGYCRKIVVTAADLENTDLENADLENAQTEHPS